MSKHQDVGSFTAVEGELQQALAKARSSGTIKSTNSSLKYREYRRKGDITLEKVVYDMAQVFNDLKNGISLVNSAGAKNEVYTNVEHELELIYQKQEELNRLKQEEVKKKTETPVSLKKKRNQVKTNPNKPKLSSENQVKKTVNLKSSFIRAGSEPVRSSSEQKKSALAVTNLKFPTEPNAISTSVKPFTTPQVKTNPTLLKSSHTSSNRSGSIAPPREVYNPLGIIKDEVDRAIREKKTFTIKGQFPAVRRALIKRGWIEKYHTNYRDRINEDIRKYLQLSVGELVDLSRNKGIAETVKKIIKSKLLRDHQVDLYWDHSYDAFKECSDNVKLTLINRFRRESFSYTSKQGLCQAAREAQWLNIPGVACINHPRCYLLTKGGDTKSFLKDFGLTAACSLLKWVVRNNITGESKIVSDSGKIPLMVFDFAIAECYKYVKIQNHKDIDEDMPEALEIEWHEFLEQFYKTVHIGHHFKLPDKSIHPSQETKDLVRRANYLLNQLREYMPCLDMDGYMNIWILKPTNSSRGEGIHICRTLSYILDIVKKNPTRRYVIQKYIERPFLIHDTKFDIRQWFLVTSAYPLTIWMYRVCYLRFSSQTYNLRKLHESIHLTNNSVQAKYLHRGTNDPLLPSYGMWDSQQFKSYLSDIGYPDIFEKVIYVGMKQCIIAAMIAHRDKIDRRRNCFELYGADFMLSETFEPWILEINSSPALYASTPVTAKLCPEVLKDVIKVVIDNARNSQASTGNFELIYNEKPDAYITKTKQKLEVAGCPIPDNYFCDLPPERESKKKSLSTVPKKMEVVPDPRKHLLQTGQTMKEALRNLLEIVKKEKLKRFVIANSTADQQLFIKEYLKTMGNNRTRKEKSIEVKMATDDSFNQTESEVISLYQNVTITKAVSDTSCKAVIDVNSEDELSETESKKIADVLGEIGLLHKKKQVLSSLVKVVDTLTRTKRCNNRL